jgi:hypothetical protein
MPSQVVVPLLAVEPITGVVSSRELPPANAECGAGLLARRQMGGGFQRRDDNERMAMLLLNALVGNSTSSSAGAPWGGTWAGFKGVAQLGAEPAVG